MSLSVYVIAAWDWHPRVRDLHSMLRARGLSTLSTWAESAHGPERLDELTNSEASAAWQTNRDAILLADAVLVLADSPAGEGFMEAEFARALGKRVIWVGRDRLTSRMMGDRGEWTRVSHVGAAIDALCAMARESAE